MTATQAGSSELDRPALRWERSKGTPVEYAIWPERPVTIGREPTNTIAIDSPFVSKAHAVLQFNGGRYVLEDLGSANGTRVNGAPISTAVVNVGDVIEIGDERLVFIDRAAKEAIAGGAGLGKTAKLALAAGGTLVVGMLLMALLLSATQPANGRRTAPGAVDRSSGLPSSGAVSPAVPVNAESQLTRDVAQRAQAAGVRPIDALMDEGMLRYRVGRLREAAELFAAALAHDPRNELARGRLQATNTQLARAIETHMSAAERAFSQLRFDAAAAEWEQVLQLTDVRDPRHSQAETGILKARNGGIALIPNAR